MRYLRDPVEFRCPACSKRYTGTGNDPCPRCGGVGACDGSYVDFQGAMRQCLIGGEGCFKIDCPAVHPPQGSW